MKGKDRKRKERKRRKKKEEVKNSQSKKKIQFLPVIVIGKNCDVGIVVFPLCKYPEVPPDFFFEHN